MVPLNGYWWCELDLMSSGNGTLTNSNGRNVKKQIISTLSLHLVFTFRRFDRPVRHISVHVHVLYGFRTYNGSVPLKGKALIELPHVLQFEVKHQYSCRRTRGPRISFCAVTKGTAPSPPYTIPVSPVIHSRASTQTRNILEQRLSQLDKRQKPVLEMKMA